MSYLNLISVVSIALLSSSPAFAAATQKSFTPTKYLYPIVKIELQTADGTGTQTVYQCVAGTSAGCMVDVADASGVGLAAITTAAERVRIDPGTYTKVKLWNCPAGTSGTTLTSTTIQGQAVVSGVTYSTGPTGMTATSTVADTVIPTGCGGASATLTTPVVIAAGSSQALSLLVDLTNVTWTDDNVSPGLGGCFIGTSGARDICSAMPLVVPYVGTGTPTFERYYIAHSNAPGTPPLVDANAAVNLGIDPAGAVFYVGVQPFFSETSAANGNVSNGGPDYYAATRTLSTNADNSLAFQTGGSIEDNRVGFTQFRRSDHTGTCKNETASATTWYYKAYRQ